MKLTAPRANAVVGGLVLTGIAAGLWLGVLSPRLSYASEVTERADAVSVSNTSLLAQVGRLRDMAARAPEVAARAQALFSTMPQEAELPAVLDQISGAARQSGIPADGILAISPAEPMPLTAEAPAGTMSSTAAEAASLGVRIATLPMSITVQGDPAALRAFVDRLQNLDRAFMVTGTEFTTGPAVSGRGRVTQLVVTGTLYVLASQLPDLVAQVQESLQQAQAPTAKAVEGAAPTAPQE